MGGSLTRLAPGGVGGFFAHNSRTGSLDARKLLCVFVTRFAHALTEQWAFVGSFAGKFGEKKLNSSDIRDIGVAQLQSTELLAVALLLSAGKTGDVIDSVHHVAHKGIAPGGRAATFNEAACFDSFFNW